MRKWWIRLVREYFMNQFELADPEVLLYTELPDHLRRCEEAAVSLFSHYPEVDQEIVLMSVWLHDIGQTKPPKEDDHAIKSERVARQFLTEAGERPEVIEAVAHCVRAHRNKDVHPMTAEAKFLAGVDSMSHMSDVIYIRIIEQQGRLAALDKLWRDWRDINRFVPVVSSELRPVYEAWKQLIRVFPT